MCISQTVLNRFGSTFGFYISWPILTKYMIPHQISTTSNLNTCNYYISSQLSTDFVQTLDSTYMTKYKKPHQISTNPTTSNIKISTISNAYISVNSLSILVKFWIINLMTIPNKPYYTKPCPDPSISGLYPRS